MPGSSAWIFGVEVDFEVLGVRATFSASNEGVEVEQQAATSARAESPLSNTERSTGLSRKLVVVASLGPPQTQIEPSLHRQGFSNASTSNDAHLVWLGISRIEELTWSLGGCRFGAGVGLLQGIFEPVGKGRY